METTQATKRGGRPPALTDEQVLEIADLHHNHGWRIAQLQRKFAPNSGANVIRQALTGQTHKHLKRKLGVIPAPKGTISHISDDTWETIYNAVYGEGDVNRHELAKQHGINYAYMCQKISKMRKVRGNGQ